MDWSERFRDRSTAEQGFIHHLIPAKSGIQVRGSTLRRTKFYISSNAADRPVIRMKCEMLSRDRRGLLRRICTDHQAPQRRKMKIYLLHRLKTKSSSIEIRHTIRRARACPNTLAVLHRLFWPFPWNLPPATPLSYDQLQASPDLIDTRQSGIRHLFEIPLFRVRDSPLNSIYRLHDDLCVSRLILLSYECEYLFRQNSKRWLLCQLPDPRDDDPIRYAILASLVEALVDAFNWRLKLGLRRGGSRYRQSKGMAIDSMLEEAPLWAKKAAPVGSPVDLINYEAEPFAQLDDHFLKRNIKAVTGYLYTI